MKYAIISDVHGNLEALEAVIADMRDQHVDKAVCLGDLVGYYPNPAECLRAIRSWSIQCIGGNHDRAVTGKIPLEDFNPAAREALYWTREHLGEDDLRWLASLPEELVVDGCFLMVHGAPGDPDAYLFLADEAELALQILAERYSGIRLCFYGHTHQRAVWSWPSCSLGDEIHLEQHGLYLINPGSVGQARDGIPGASYLTFDAEAGQINFRRLAYPYHVTQQKVRGAGLPLLLAERLAVGV